MAKWYGSIGFYNTIETAPGVFDEKIEVKKYYGDSVRCFSRFVSSQERQNDDVFMSNVIEILMDPYLDKHIGNIRFVEINGIRWKVETIEFEYPRIKLGLGGVYNGS